VNPRGLPMPFYEYECSACKFYVEALQKISDPPLKQCPSCKKQTLKRLVSAPVFRLKGDGWYETDFKSEKEGKRNLAANEESVETKADDAKEAKPEKESGKAAGKPAETKADKPERKKTMVAKPARKPATKPAKAKARPKAPARKKKRR
ncbi:MAG: FmdB family zinc ribbon protein, partial [Steroidobacteraceae bacterium]